MGSEAFASAAAEAIASAPGASAPTFLVEVRLDLRLPAPPEADASDFWDDEVPWATDVVAL